MIKVNEDERQRRIDEEKSHLFDMLTCGVCVESEVAETLATMKVDLEDALDRIAVLEAKVKP